MGACTGVFVRKNISGGWDVWQGPTQVDGPPDRHYGAYPTRGDALCKAHDVCEGLPVIGLQDERAPPTLVIGGLAWDVAVPPEIAAWLSANPPRAVD